MFHTGIFGSAFTGPADPRFEPEPDRRGTFAIFSTCFLTLGLCVWTSLHFNVPGHNESGMRQFIRKTGWMTMGLVCPELVRSSPPLSPFPTLTTSLTDCIHGVSAIHTSQETHESHESTQRHSWLLCAMEGQNQEVMVMDNIMFQASQEHNGHGGMLDYKPSNVRIELTRCWLRPRSDPSGP